MVDSVLLNVAGATLDRVDASDNNNGLQVSSAADVVIAHGTFAANHTGVLAVSGSQNLLLTLEGCELARNSTELRLDGTLGTVYTTIANSNVGHSAGVGAGIGLEVRDGATVRLAATTVTQNATGILVSGTGVVQSQGNNLIFGNTSDGPAPTVVGSK